MEVAKAACITHRLLDHMHGLIHGLAPLLLALRGHLYSTTSTKVKTRLEVLHITRQIAQLVNPDMTQPSHGCPCTSIYTLISFQPCRLELQFIPDIILNKKS